MSEIHPVCVRLTATEREALSALAAAEHRTVSDQLRSMIETSARKYFPVKIERNSGKHNTNKINGMRKSGKSAD